MTKSINSIFLWFLTGLILLAVSCGSEKSTGNKNEGPVIIRNDSRLIAPKGLVKLGLSDSMEIEIAGRDSVQIDSISVGYNGRQLLSSSSNRVNIPVSSLNITGRPRIIVKVFLSNGKTEALYPKFNILPAPASQIGYKITREYPHDRSSYTQGLLFKDGALYESTGQNGTSRVMKVDMETGKAIKAIDLDNSLFGEGITFVGDSLYHLTYRAGQAFLYDSDLNKQHTFNYDGEGWGLTTYGDTILMTNGSENVYFRDKYNFSVIKTLTINDHNGPVRELNELEIIDGFLYANIYQEDEIVKIDLSNGAVVGRINLSDIFPERNSYGSAIDVLNGIAYLPEKKKVYVTGKLWPKLYEIELIQ